MTLKINGATGGSVSIDAPDNTSPAGTDVTLTLPVNDGDAGQYLQTDGTGALSWQTVEGLPDAIDVNASAPADSLVIDSFGNLGIGVTSPGAPLEVQSNQGAEAIYLRGNSSNISQMHFRNNAGSSTQFRISSESNNTQLNAFGSSYLTFVTNSTECMRLTSNGSFKATKTGSYYGSSNDEHELVQDTPGVWVARAVHATTSANNAFGIIVHYNNITPNSTSAQFFYALDSTGLKFEVRSNGGISNYQSNNNNLCDEREKKNIVDLDSTWDCLKHWELKKFHYNEDADTDDKRYGVIAQQIAEHCPEVITDWVKRRAEDAVLDDDGNVVTPAQEEIVRMGVKEQQMYWMAIRALQEAQTRIETLEAANASQAATIAALDARLTALEGGAA